jgi:hypothetical protein
MFDGVVLHHAADHLLRLFKLMFLTVMFVKALFARSSTMFPQQSEILARSRMAEIKRAAEPRAKIRSSLRIMLESRRERERSPAG